MVYRSTFRSAKLFQTVQSKEAPGINTRSMGEFGYIFISEDSGETWKRGEILGEVRMDPIPLDFDQLDLKDEDIERLTAFAKQIEDETHLNPVVSMSMKHF